MRTAAFLVSMGIALSARAVPAASCRNGLYLTPDWIRVAKADSDIEVFLTRIASVGITELFIPSNGLKPEHQAQLSHFLAIARATDGRFRIYAMVGRRVCGESKEGCFDASDPRKQLEIEEKAKALWGAGFDGVQLDFEPVADGDEALVSILRRVHAARPAGKTVSLAGYFLRTEGANAPRFNPQPRSKAPLLQWSRGYYQRLFDFIDQVMVMNYDTALREPAQYREFSAWQTRQFLDLAKPKKVAVQIGLPSDVPGRSGLFDRKAENLGTGTEGVAEALKEEAGDCPGGFGITVFAESGFLPELFKTFGETWAHAGGTPGAGEPRKPSSSKPGT